MGVKFQSKFSSVNLTLLASVRKTKQKQPIKLGR